MSDTEMSDTGERGEPDVDMMRATGGEHVEIARPAVPFPPRVEDGQGMPREILVTPLASTDAPKIAVTIYDRTWQQLNLRLPAPPRPPGFSDPVDPSEPWRPGDGLPGDPAGPRLFGPPPVVWLAHDTRSCEAPKSTWGWGDTEGTRKRQHNQDAADAEGTSKRQRKIFMAQTSAAHVLGMDATTLHPISAEQLRALRDAHETPFYMS